MEQESPLASQTRTNNQQQEVLHNSRQSNFKRDFTKEMSFRSLNRSGSGGSHGPPGLLPGGINQMHTSKIVNRALEVMSKTLKDADYTPQKPRKPVDDDYTSDESETAHPSDSSNSDNEIDVPPQPMEPNRRLGNLKAQLSFRKIAKKRRKAGGQSSFHHTKSSKEYLRKAQEAYQRLKISEQQEQKDQNSQPELESTRDTVEKSKTAAPIKTKESEAIDYGYGDTTKKERKDEVDYGYGDSTESQPDYGYGDAAPQPQSFRRIKPKRRNSVTKYSAQAANVVAAQAAAARIMKLNPNMTSTSRSPTVPSRRQHLEERPHARGRSGNIATMQTSLQKEQEEQDNEGKVTIQIPLEQMEARQRSLRRGGSGSVMQSPRLQVTSDYFSSDPKPKNLVQRGRVNGGTTFRFSAPSRTSSWLSNDTINKTDDDDDCDVDSLASDMESLCSFRDSSYHSSTHMNDLPPVLPGSDRRSRFAGGRSISGDMIRRPLVVSFSNGSNKCRSVRRERSGSNDFSILPPVGVVTTNGSSMKSCMPAPVRRTPSYKGPRHD